MLIFAADRAIEQASAPLVTRIEASGLRRIYAEVGELLPEDKEHFGFQDGISQPGVLGVVEVDGVQRFVTTRYGRPRPPGRRVRQAGPAARSAGAVPLRRRGRPPQRLLSGLSPADPGHTGLRRRDRGHGGSAARPARACRDPGRAAHPRRRPVAVGAAADAPGRQPGDCRACDRAEPLPFRRGCARSRPRHRRSRRGNARRSPGPEGWPVSDLVAHPQDQLPRSADRHRRSRCDERPADAPAGNPVRDPCTGATIRTTRTIAASAGCCSWPISGRSPISSRH